MDDRACDGSAVEDEPEVGRRRILGQIQVLDIHCMHGHVLTVHSVAGRVTPRAADRCETGKFSALHGESAIFRHFKSESATENRNLQ